MEFQMLALFYEPFNSAPHLFRNKNQRIVVCAGTLETAKENEYRADFVSIIETRICTSPPLPFIEQNIKCRENACLSMSSREWAQRKITSDCVQSRQASYILKINSKSSLFIFFLQCFGSNHVFHESNESNWPKHVCVAAQQSGK